MAHPSTIVPLWSDPDIGGREYNHPDQIGFKHLNGVAYNMLKLQRNLGEAWRRHEELVTLVLNHRKAFDSVSCRLLHHTIEGS